MYTITENGHPIHPNEMFKNATNLTVTDRYFGDEYLVQWVISNGVAVASKAPAEKPLTIYNTRKSSGWRTFCFSQRATKEWARALACFIFLAVLHTIWQRNQRLKRKEALFMGYEVCKFGMLCLSHEGVPNIYPVPHNPRVKGNISGYNGNPKSPSSA